MIMSQGIQLFICLVESTGCANVIKEEKELCLEAGVDEYWSKPIPKSLPEEMV